MHLEYAQATIKRVGGESWRLVLVVVFLREGGPLCPTTIGANYFSLTQTNTDSQGCVELMAVSLCDKKNVKKGRDE